MLEYFVLLFKEVQFKGVWKSFTFKRDDNVSQLGGEFLTFKDIIIDLFLSEGNDLLAKFFILVVELFFQGSYSLSLLVADLVEEPLYL